MLGDKLQGPVTLLLLVFDVLFEMTLAPGPRAEEIAATAALLIEALLLLLLLL